MIDLARRHWAASFVLACLLHLLLAAILVLKGTDPLARGKGEGGLEVQLTRAGGSPSETAHTRNRIDEAVGRAASEAAPRIDAEEAARAASPSETSEIAPPVVRDTSLTPAPESPVPPDVSAVAPASEELPDATVETEPVAAAEAAKAAVQSAAPVTPEADPVPAVPPSSTVTARPVEAARPRPVESPRSVDAQPVSTAPPAAESQPALPVEAAAIETRSLPLAESTAPDAVAPTSPPQEVQAGAPDAPVAAEAAPPPPDDLPPLESVSSVAPDSATTTNAAEAADAPVETAESPAAAEAAAPSPSVETVAPEGPASARSRTEAEAAATVAPEAARPARGAETVTRSGSAPENAGVVGPQESLLPGRGGAGGIETVRTLDGTGEDRVERRGGRNYDRKLYTSVATAWLQLHRRYPEEAREAGLEGLALVYIVIERNGDVRSFRVIQSTGYAVLDKEILEAVERAKPFPVIPDTDHRDEVDLILPVKFEIRR